MAALEIERHGATAVLLMNRPEQRNALDMEMRTAFASAVSFVRDEPDVRAVVLTGAGGNFCAGGDVRVMADQPDTPPNMFDSREGMRELHRWFDELVDLEKPVIAAVDGSAFGAGMSIALAADYVLASSRAKFCCAFARMGYVPDLASMYLLPRLVGLPRAKDLVFTARVVPASEALAIGLVQQIYETDVLGEALALARRFHDAPVQSLGAVKAVMNHAFESERRVVLAQEAMLQSMCRATKFHKEAVRRFLAKEAQLYDWTSGGTSRQL